MRSRAALLRLILGLAVRSVSCLGLVLGSPHSIQPAAAQENSAVSQPQGLNRPGLVAEITECKRQDGVLSVQMRIRNTGTNDTSVFLIQNRNFDQYYVTAAAKKYMILEDTEHAPVATPASFGGSLSVDIPKNGSYVWWAKFPAPPADVKSVSIFTPITPPFDNVPISG